MKKSNELKIQILKEEIAELLNKRNKIDHHIFLLQEKIKRIEDYERNQEFQKLEKEKKEDQTPIPSTPTSDYSEISSLNPKTFKTNFGE